MKSPDIRAVTEAKLAERIPLHFHVGSNAPTQTTVDGLPVIWVDTFDSLAHVPADPTFNVTLLKVTIPTDRGAVYYIDGVLKAAGDHYISETGLPRDVVVTAVAKDGVTLSGTDSWVMNYSLTPVEYDAIGLNAPYYFRFDDAAPHRNRGTGTITPQSVAFTETGQKSLGVGAASVNGQGGYLRFANAHATATAVTVMGVCEPIGASNGRSIATLALISVTDVGNGTALNFNYKNAGSWILNNAFAPTEGVPFHYMATYDGLNAKLYINGVLLKHGVSSSAGGAMGSIFEVFTPNYGYCAGVIYDPTSAWPAEKALEGAQIVGLA